MRERLRHRALPLVDARRSGKRSADIQVVPRLIGVRSAKRTRLEPDQRRAGLQLQPLRERAVGVFDARGSISCPRASRPPAPMISEKRVRERSG